MKKNLDINRLWLAQSQRIHVHHGPCIYSSQNIEEEEKDYKSEYRETVSPRNDCINLTGTIAISMNM